MYKSGKDNELCVCVYVCVEGGIVYDIVFGFDIGKRGVCVCSVSVCLGCLLLLYFLFVLLEFV